MRSVILIIGLLCSGVIFSQSKPIVIESEKVLYRQVDTASLYLHVYRPLDFNPKKKYPAIMFIHGGGWNQGSYKAFNRQCMYFASRGMLTISIDYRVRNVHGTTPFDATEDAIDAYEYVIEHSKELNIDKKNVVTGGGSAGGHLATAIAFKSKVKHLPKALLLFNPVLDTGPEGFGFRRMEGRYEEISPIDNIGENHPPTIIMVGTNDKVLPVSTAKRYKELVEQQGQKCKLVLYKDQEHSFFNTKEFFVDTVLESDLFLKELGLIDGDPSIQDQIASYEVDKETL